MVKISEVMKKKKLRSTKSVVRRQNDRKSQIAKKNVKRNLQLEDKQQ
jgi:hypothetical protein